MGERGSGWIVDKIKAMHIKISNHDPLSGSSYIPLPPKLNNSMKGLINLKNKDIECFKWCHVKNPIKKKKKKIKNSIYFRL